MTDFSPLGMVVDGDLMRDVIADAVPQLLTDEAARAIADAALDLAVRAGMTVIHGPESTPRTVDAPDMPTQLEALADAPEQRGSAVGLFLRNAASALRESELQADNRKDGDGG